MWWFNKTFTGEFPRIQISGTLLQAGLYDPVTGLQFDGYTDLTTASPGDLWMLWVIRMDQTAKSAKFRWYGLHEGNGVDYDFDQNGPWLNSYTTLDFAVGYNGGSYVDVEVDEIMIWDRQLTDAECDTLGAGALPPEDLI